MSKNGLILLTPTSIAYTGTSATISANGSVTFSDCSALSLNGVFSADYDNYRIVIWLEGQGGSESAVLRMRASGVDESSASNYYTYQLLGADSTTISASRTASTGAAWFRNNANVYSGYVSELYGPYLAQPTAGRVVGCYSDSGGRIADASFTHSQSISYDGFTLFTTDPAQYMDVGRVAVYGMRK